MVWAVVTKNFQEFTATLDVVLFEYISIFCGEDDFVIVGETALQPGDSVIDKLVVAVQAHDVAIIELPLMHVKQNTKKNEKL